MIKILIVEDQTMLRESLERIIGGQNDMEVSGTTDDAAEATELCRELQVDLVLMDVVTKNNASGITYTAQIRAEFPNIKIVIMTGFSEITFIDEARKAGAHSYVYKNSGYEHLFYVIRSTMQGNGIYPGPENNLPFDAQFDERELAVIRLVCKGKSRTEIVKELGMSEAVVKRIISAILEKTEFDNIMKFAIYAVSRGLIVPDNEMSR
jgi:DNA-binding NarL/FixJ family response regulator